MSSTQSDASVSETIDWTNNPDGTTMNFDERFSAAYMGKSLRSDMTFFIEDDNISIPAHSLIVAAASKELECLIFGSGSIVNTDRVVTVRDCSLKEFNVMLRYLYTGLLDAELSVETASSLMPLAHYFCLQKFEDHCEKRILDNLTEFDVCDTFEKIHFMDSVLVTSHCMEIIKENLYTLLANGSLMQMPDPSLDKIMHSDSLSIRCESDLLAPMLRWADEECAHTQMEPNAANRRSIINDRLYYIRFAAMSANVFSKCLPMVGNGFFTNDEISDTLLRITMGADFKSTLTNKPFSNKPRISILGLEVVRGAPAYNDDDNVLETFYQKTLRNTHIVGFESDNVFIESILDAYNRNVPFTKVGNRVTFTPNISFKEKKCSFTIYSYMDFYECIYKVKSLTGDNNIYMMENSISSLTKLYVR